MFQQLQPTGGRPSDTHPAQDQKESAPSNPIPKGSSPSTPSHTLENDGCKQDQTSNRQLILDNAAMPHITQSGRYELTFATSGLTLSNGDPTARGQAITIYIQGGGHLSIPISAAAVSPNGEVAIAVGSKVLLLRPFSMEPRLATIEPFHRCFEIRTLDGNQMKVPLFTSAESIIASVVFEGDTLIVANSSGHRVYLELPLSQMCGFCVEGDQRSRHSLILPFP